MTHAPSVTASSQLLSSVALQSSLASLAHAVTHAVIHPWWSRLSSNDKTLEEEVQRLLGLVGREIKRRIIAAEGRGDWDALVSEHLPLRVDKFIRTSRISKGDFAIYSAHSPSEYLRIDGKEPSVSPEKLHVLATHLLNILLPEQERKSELLNSIVRDVLVMVLRLAVERGSCGWMWVRAARTAMRKASSRSKSANQSSQKSTWSQLPLVWANVTHAYHRWRRGNNDGQDAVPRLSTNYIALFATLFDLHSSYTGRLTLGMTLIASRFFDEEMDRIARYHLRSVLAAESTWLNALGAIRSTLLPDGHRFPPRVADPSISEQQREYLLFVDEVDKAIPPLLRHALLGSHQPKAKLQTSVLDPIFSPSAHWQRADLVASLLERLCLVLIPELADDSVKAETMSLYL